MLGLLIACLVSLLGIIVAGVYTIRRVLKRFNKSHKIVKTTDLDHFQYLNPEMHINVKDEK